MEKENKLGTMPISKLIINMSLPIIISMLVQALYNIVDSVFVSRVCEQALTAVSLAFPAQNLMIGLATGTAVGVNALMGRALGAKDQERANAVAINGVFLAVVGFAICAVLALLFAGPFFRSQTQIDYIVENGTDYLLVCCCGSLGLFCEIMFERLLQGTGRSILSMYTQGLGAIVNIVLDPILIFGLGPVPALGIAGAALATGIGQLLSLCVYLFVYARIELPVRLRRSCLRPDAALDGKLYAIGVPAILNLALPSLLVTFLNGLLAVYSQSYVTVLGIYYKLQTFLYLPANGIVQGMRPLVGYNYGAREHGRVSRLYNLTLGLSAGIMAIGTLLCLTIAGPLMGLFTSNPETIAIGQTALRIICLGFIVSAVSTTSSGALEGLGKGVPSLVISLCRYIIFIMPIAWVLCGRMGPTGVWHAFWITEALSAVIAYAVYHKAVHQK